MSETKLHDIKACFFDAYGTLFNVHAPVAALASRIGPNADDVSKLWRLKQLEYTWLRSLMDEYDDFWRVTGDALDYALETHGVHDDGLRNELMDMYFKLEAYPDAVACLEGLKAKGMMTGILSNGSPDMLSGAVNHSGVAKSLDHVLSVENIGIFKPDRRIYQMVLNASGVTDASQICFVSANPWDAQAGAHFGFQVTRINRFGLIDDNIPGRPKMLLDSLTELLDVIEFQHGMG